MTFTQKQIDRFWSKVDIKGEDECWEWTAGKDKDGYGKYRINKKHYRSHRFMWIIHNGDIPEGLSILHFCDNPSCCNKNHLFLGTQKDNIQDKVNKNRQSRIGPQGIKNGKHKLTEEQVIEIRQKYIPWKYNYRMLAEEYGVLNGCISNIILRRSWKYL